MTTPAMSLTLKRIAALAKRDGRYRLDAYLFVQQALLYAQVKMGMERSAARGDEDFDDDDLVDELVDESTQPEGTHLTGQQLCEAAHHYAADLYGRMAKVVLNSWGVYTTRDFGEIVYNLIDIQEMSKSDTDRREDFDDVYDFDEAFLDQYRITILEDP
jgi:uncharacterized repeat protein (TIGR04138 family)